MLFSFNHSSCISYSHTWSRFWSFPGRTFTAPDLDNSTWFGRSGDPCHVHRDQQLGTFHKRIIRTCLFVIKFITVHKKTLYKVNLKAMFASYEPPHFSPRLDTPSTTQVLLWRSSLIPIRRLLRIRRLAVFPSLHSQGRVLSKQLHISNPIMKIKYNLHTSF